jgi:hypothetical protein
LFALELYSGDGKVKRNSGLRVFNCLDLQEYLCILVLWGVWHCDVAYLPKKEIVEME